jgi:hypothetical protein
MVLVVVLTALTTSDIPASSPSAAEQPQAPIATVEGPPAVEPESEPALEPVVTAEPEPVIPAEPTEPELTMGQQQAVGKGEDYLGFTAFSRKGLIDQLVFDGFSQRDAEFAVDYIAPDWNEQAAKKAQDYLDMTSFSRQGLIDQLMFDGFTKTQAEYGADAVGY